MSTTRPFTRSEVRQILRSPDISTRDRTYITFACNSGFRVSEILSLKISDVASIIKGKLEIASVVTVDAKNMKGKKMSRSCRINSDCKKALFNHITELFAVRENLNDALFTGRKSGGGRENRKSIGRITAFRIIKAASSLALGQVKSLANHSCRKFFATALYEKSRDILLVSKALFHSSVITTQIYLKSSGSLGDEIEGLI